ncbi:site-2 protease family protein [Sutcliffiella rhizosphaerae]|uniref:Peptidase M50 domain-containing protein n=1 Tax=Sutcliffiella rhizosphaerae TaxID=2880967 RepID=A0ABN8ADK6_9BACI|nr:site-2 protease family protein [Sutcliffiella rhizosphaerae]CAG9620800.1 hypothetical protein BACCIP111883_01571 [Sutcliffiella rhizosphaerae]
MLDALVFFYLIVPLVHLIHETGHVVMAKLYHVKGTKIRIGIGPKVMESTLFDTNFRIHIIPFLGGYSTNDSEKELSPKATVWISAGGPMFNFISIIFLFPFLTSFEFSYHYLFFLYSLWIGGVNLLPFKLFDKKSDGWQIAASLITLIRTR